MAVAIAEVSTAAMMWVRVVEASRISRVNSAPPRGTL